MLVEGLSHKLFVPSGVKLASRLRNSKLMGLGRSSSNCSPAADDGHGMKVVLESGPWMVNNIPLVLNIWEHDIWLENVEPSSIPIWVCVWYSMELCSGNEIVLNIWEHDIWLENVEPSSIPIWVCVWYSMELCSGNEIGKILSGIVEVFAIDDLHCPLEIEYPQIRDRTARIGPEDEIVAIKVRGAEKSKVDSTVIGCEFLASINEEFDSAVWPKLKLEVISVMKSSIYPSLKTRSDWSSSQLDFFYKSCSNYGMEPYVDDDDVESENGGG
nr:hypothetical protein [Tanacetum cinerariifolium]